MKLIAIGGGIGSGKSVVCRILHSLGYQIYDCDSRARKIMDESLDIINTIEAEIAPNAIKTTLEGNKIIHRPSLASAVFSNPDKLNALNALVHSAVRNDIAHWAHTIATNCHNTKNGNYIAFIESAIIIESGLDTMVDEIWEVTAPIHIRINRVKNRDNLSMQQIQARIQAQKALSNTNAPVFTIINDNKTQILPQIFRLLKQLNA